MFGGVCLVLCAGLLVVAGQLSIKVSKGTEQASVIQETIFGNTTADTVTIEFNTPEGDAVKQVTDLKNKVVITVYTVPAEEDLGEQGYQVICFVSAYAGDLIPSEAVTKLRQKHSGTVRIAEEHKGNTVQDNPVRLLVSKSSVLSPHIPTLCRKAKQTTFTSDGEMSKLVNQPAKYPALFNKNIQPYLQSKRCGDLPVSPSSSGCICSLSSCVWWYPCSLKYCRSGGGEVEHRCGIRTCSRCTTHRYLVDRPELCSWDLP